MVEVPSAAQVVVIGGGIIGCSTAYHLTRAGVRDVVLLERHKLTSGTSFHAAGLVGQLRSSANITRLLKYSVELYGRLEAETGQATGFKQNGGLRLACNAERMTEIRRQATTAHSFGLEMHLLGPKEAGELWPIMETKDLVGAAYLPTDGQANPSDLTQALAKGARAEGARIVEGVSVTGIKVVRGRVVGVVTDAGEIACESLVNCAGQWAPGIGRLAGVSVPLSSMQHQYLVTERIEGVEPGLPTLRDPDGLIYFKEDVGGLVMGGYEHRPLPWAEQGIPEGFVFSLLDWNYEQFEPLMESALHRVPKLAEAGVRQFVNGPESFTPDGNFILGEAPGLRGFFVGAGFNAFGIAAAGGAGWALAEWVARGEPPMDLAAVDIRRFGQPHRSAEWVRARTVEATGKHYTMAWPHEEHESGRPARVSPLYGRLKAAGAVFGEKLGWERPNWFARDGEAAADVYSYGRQNWFEAVGEEHRAVRERVGLFDQSSFAKFLMVGPDAASALSWICAGDVAREVGRLTYSQLLNRRGGIECDLTVARLAEDRFYIVTGTGAATRDFDWIERNIPEGANAQLIDVTSAYAVLTVMGPRARALLARVTAADLSNEAFPFATWRDLPIGGAPVRALRVTYEGELGWELHLPSETAAAVYDRLVEAGADLGLANCGYRAIESLRLEKGYRAWGSDITSDDTPLEAGLGFAVKLKSNQPFLGREALLAQREAGLRKRLACFTVEDPSVVLLGRETLYRDGKRVGYLASAGWGYTVGANIGYGYVRSAEPIDRAFLSAGRYELEVAGEKVACAVHEGPLYDPTMERVKA
ncbi:4-methylaminobutanoate oxidase (formaldehyde-forming) [Tistlia consotensis]|uniref:4-methylaminobutanoate oxidase (Formaldehyde-forming) n=1 Tax=Tistlia consotensis USBA 355 TaxID=560819 RepID=A0A1Y6BYC4_9PROT|nr:FAD-dependent oxidoreductase [Tistlia consotensis]SMF35992.1 4-methylaminobutanoate oxidase (formaldehyde-forming) [Tistlia consotensis USBA 355]SNR71206.1 4-methylaminobutanoate oxidase (formaldehyde-forming) [Tistlia consotensis]